MKMMFHIRFIGRKEVKKNSTTELAALELLDRVLDQMDKHKILTNFYIDLSKAFDAA